MPRVLGKAIEELIGAGSISALRDVVARNPELLEDETVIQVLATATQNAHERVRPRFLDSGAFWGRYWSGGHSASTPTSTSLRHFRRHTI